MDMAINYAKGLTAAASVVFSYLFGGWTVLLGALMFFVTFDYISGVVAAGYEQKLNARVGFWGIPKKVMIFGLVAVAHIIDVVYIDQVGEPLAVGELQVSVMAATIIYYLVNEFISISENLGRLGMPIPRPLKKAIEIFKDDNYHNEDKGVK
ncbi:holin [Salibacterium salarium]|uniref:Holin n=1 Tax=Salibacterium salarium TaxID=284579 RepID=A0A3R9QKD0_9BACI|nr:phage holin family protein [Salibacterium salarium]RSL32679.1 holin [Salibacterium salarium]